MHQTEFKCHRARIIKAFKVESSKFALLCFRVTAATSVHHQLFVQEKYQRVLLSSASGWRKTLYHSDSMIQVNSSSRVCAASCKRPSAWKLQQSQTVFSDEFHSLSKDVTLLVFALPVVAFKSSSAASALVLCCDAQKRKSEV